MPTAKVIRLETLRGARKVTAQCRALAAALKVGKVRYDAPLVYAALMLGATICQAARVDRRTFMKWSGDCWDVCEKRHPTHSAPDQKVT